MRVNFNLCLSKRLISSQGKSVLHHSSSFCNFPQGCHDTSGTGGEHLGQSQSRALTDAFISFLLQEVSLQDVRKEIRFCQKVKVPIIGVVENMSGFVCPSCKVNDSYGA